MRASIAVLLALALAAVVVACPDPPPPPAGPVWSPGVVYPSEAAAVRGHLDVRGLIHSHSVYSHDACDSEPVLPDGTRDPVCFDDFRRGLCQSKHDFAFLTDHRDAFDETEFPDALLYREERGDELIEHDGIPTSNVITCDAGNSAMIMAGNEAAMMPVGFEGHAAPLEERGALYGSQTPEAAQQMRDHGAVVLLAHPEDYTADTATRPCRTRSFSSSRSGRRARSTSSAGARCSRAESTSSPPWGPTVTATRSPRCSRTASAPTATDA
jgi:hypothetical protein